MECAHKKTRVKAPISMSGSSTPYSHDLCPPLFTSAACAHFAKPGNDASSQDMYPNVAAEGSNDKIVKCVEHVDGRRIKHQLNFGSLHTQKAAAVLGILVENCILR